MMPSKLNLKECQSKFEQAKRSGPQDMRYFLNKISELRDKCETDYLHLLTTISRDAAESADTAAQGRDLIEAAKACEETVTILDAIAGEARKELDKMTEIEQIKQDLMK